MKILPGMLATGLLASTLYACQTQVALLRPPAAPSNLAARSVSSSRLDLSWNDNAFGVLNETGFELQYATNSAFTGATTRNLGQDKTSVSLFGLDPITTYYIRIKAEGAGGSAWSNTALGTTAPNFVVATEVMSSGIDVKTIQVEWTPTSSKNFNINSYTVRYSTAAGSCNDRAVAGRNSSTYLATGLVPSKTYNVSVRANGSAHSSAFSRPAVATTSPDGLIGTRISPLFFGQNAWLPLKIGAEEKNGDLEELLCGASYDAPGDQCVLSEVSESGVKLMRYGGRSVDRYYVPDDDLSAADDDKSAAQYLTMVDNMRANGIEPLLQVPYWDGEHSAEDAAALVRYINITHDRCVRYWTIANEPNHLIDIEDDPVDKYGLDAAAIADYFKEYVTAMRDVDPTIVIVGPDLDSYDDGIMNELLTGGSDICGLMKNDDLAMSNYIGPDGKTHYYLDVVDFHTYPFPKDGLTQTRQEVIDQPSDGFQADLDALKARVELCNSARPAESALRMAVTEINVEYDNDIDRNLPVDTNLSGVTAQSFLAGQYWAEVMNVGMKNGLEFMAFWSVKEGDPQIGYIAHDGTKLPTYYHYQMLAQNFRGVYAPATTVEVNGSPDANVKAFGAKDLDQIVVMLLNEQQAPAPALTYTVRLDTGTITGALESKSALKVNIRAGVSRQYSPPPIADGARGALAPESTVMLVFDASGTLQRRHVYGRLSSGTAAPTVYTN